MPEPALPPREETDSFGGPVLPGWMEPSASLPLHQPLQVLGFPHPMVKGY